MKSYICSFDIGKKNFAFCIEEFDKDTLTQIKNIPLTRRYNPNGTPTIEMEAILQKVYKEGKIILHENLDLTKNCDPKKKLDPETFHNMVDVLERYTEYWDKCDTFIIEEQMSFGKAINKMAMKLGQHCYSYFCIKYGRTKQIIEFPAYHKTQVLGAPKIAGKPTKNGKERWKAVDKPQRKKWSAQKAAIILRDRGELEILKGIKTVSKKDDLADTFLQLKAYQYLTYVDTKK